MTKRSKYSELAFFLILNIFLALPLLYFRITSAESIFWVLGLFYGISFTYTIYLKFTVFDFLYRRKNLHYTHKFLNKFLTDKKFFFIVVTGAIAVDVILNLIFPDFAPLFKFLKTTEDIPFWIFILLLGITGVTFSYLGFWCIQQFKNFKNDFWAKNRLTGFKKLVLYKLFSPFVVHFCIIIIEAILWHFYKKDDNVFSETVLPVFFVSTFIQLTIDVFISSMIGKIKKSVILEFTRIFREIEIFIALFGLNCFLLFMGVYGCMADLESVDA